jgi:hypothetical protein
MKWKIKMLETTNQLFVWKNIGYPQTLMADHHDGHLPHQSCHQLSEKKKKKLFSDKAQMVVLDPAGHFFGSPCELASLKRIEISEISLVSGDKSSDKSSIPQRFSKDMPDVPSSVRFSGRLGELSFSKNTNPSISGVPNGREISC